MSFYKNCVPHLLASILLIVSISATAAAAEQSPVQYLLFQIFWGGTEYVNGVYHKDRSSDQILRIAQRIADAVRPAQSNPNRIPGFAVGPIAMDRGEDARAVIRAAFDVALATDLAVALHLDDYMFWDQARWPDGRLLRAEKGTTEWRDWSETPAGALEIGWMRNVKLAPQLCYESPVVRNFTTYWTRDVIGQEIKKQVDRLAQAGKARLFAGVIAGWESNLSYGYCSLSHLGYSAQTPPTDFDRERERVLQRHVELWARGISDASIPKSLIFTHLAPMPVRQYEKVSAFLSRSRIREIPGSTAFHGFWTAFNDYSNPGFSAYLDVEEGRFEDIYAALREHGRQSWAMAEGTNVILGAPGTPQGDAARSPLSWETYLARNFNHGAAIVNIFGGFQGEAAEFQRSTEGSEALAAYRKFLQGDRLVEDKRQ